MLGETEKSSDVCRTALLSEMGHDQRAATSSTVTDHSLVPEPDCFLQYCISAATLNFTSGKSDIYVYVLAAAVRHGFKMVLFTEPHLSEVRALHRVPF